MAQEKLSRDDYIQMSVDSGVNPLELRYTPINDCYDKVPKAYRTQVLVNSVMMGQLKEASFLEKIQGTKEEADLFAWSLKEAIRSLQVFENSGKHPLFLAVKCPLSLAEKAGLYDFVKDIFEKQGFTHPEQICLEFPKELLVNPTEQKKVNILDMKLLKVQTCATGCGVEQFPLMNLLKIPVDLVLIHPDVVQKIGDRDYPQMFSSFVAFLQSMKVQYLAEGLKNDNQISTLSRAECIGYIADESYQGNAEKTKPVLALEEALKQKWNEE